jgi:hypothetical protein
MVAVGGGTLPLEKERKLALCAPYGIRTCVAAVRGLETPAQPPRWCAQIASARKLPRPVTSLTTRFTCNSRSNAVPVCDATLSRTARAFGVRAGARSSASRASGSRDRLSPRDNRA